MGAGKSLCILILEDHQHTLEAIARLLRHKGHTVCTARTAEEARHLAAAEQCDLLVADIESSGASAIELMRELRERHGLKGIAFTGYAATQHVTDPLAAGLDPHAAPHIPLSDLLTAIEHLAR